MEADHVVKTLLTCCSVSHVMSLSSPGGLGDLCRPWHRPFCAATGQGPPRPSKTFPFSVDLSPPCNSILESPFWPADGPSILPLISPESTYSQLCPELRRLLHHPLPEAEAPHLPPPGAGNNPNPLCFPHPHGAKTLQRGVAGWPQLCGGTNAAGTLGFPGCRYPWMCPPSAPCPRAAVAGGPVGTDAVTHQWLPGPLSCLAVLGEHQHSPKMELGRDRLNTEVCPDPRSTPGGLGDVCVCVYLLMPRRRGPHWVAAFFFFPWKNRN